MLLSSFKIVNIPPMKFEFRRTNSSAIKNITYYQTMESFPTKQSFKFIR